MAKTPRSPTAVGNDADPAPSRTVSGVDGPATPTRADDAVAARATALLDGRPEDASRAAEAAAGSALDAPGVGSGPAAEPLVLADLARGPVLGGPTVEIGAGAGLPPARMSSEGSFGGAPEADHLSLAGRNDAIEDGPALRSSGYKRAVPLPKDRTNVADLIAQGFDLIVTSKHDGFRRAGVGHPSEPTLRRSEDFTTAELMGMDADPMLVVQALR